MRSVSRVLACLLVLMQPSALFAQSATTATIAGVVTDAQGSGVPGATVTLRDQATGVTQTSTTGPEGRYLFASLTPGTYELTISLDGFQTMVIQNLRAEVTRSVRQDVRLAVAGVAESVTVVASDTTTLQRTDAAVGNTFDTIKVALLPNPTRDAMQLVTLQPAATPSGEIAGARGDQSTFTLDGVDISDNAFGEVFKTIFPTPADAIEEFKVTVASPNASFARSSGGQFTFVTRRGTNDFHGSLYEYHQNSDLNANSWTNNRLGISKPDGRDNRFGGALGGPLVRNRTFFFGMYEGRRGLGSATVTRLVPTDSLRAGLLRFRDAAGAVQTIDPRTFDPRGLGASPAMLSLLQLYPAANDLTAGDGLNTAGYTKAYDLETDSNLGIARVDQVLGNAWNLEVGWKQFDEEKQTTDQVSVADGQLVAGRPARPVLADNGPHRRARPQAHQRHPLWPHPRRGHRRSRRPAAAGPGGEPGRRFRRNVARRADRRRPRCQRPGRRGQRNPDHRQPHLVAQHAYRPGRFQLPSFPGGAVPHQQGDRIDHHADGPARIGDVQRRARVAAAGVHPDSGRCALQPALCVAPRTGREHRLPRHAGRQPAAEPGRHAASDRREHECLAVLRIRFVAYLASADTDLRAHLSTVATTDRT